MYHDLILNCISHFFMLIFIYSYVFEKKYSRIAQGVLFLLAYVLLCSMEFIAIRKQNSIYAVLFMKMIQSIVTQIQPFILAKKKEIRLVLVGINAVVCISVANTFAVIVNYFINNFIFEIVLYIVAQSVIMAVIHNFFRERKQIYIPKGFFTGMFLFFIPSCTYVITFFLRSFLDGTMDQVAIIAAFIIFWILVIIVYSMILKFLNTQRREIELDCEKTAYLNMIQGMNNSISMLHTSEKKTAVLRHDIRHYLIMLDQMMKEKRYEEVEKILVKQIDSSASIAPEKYCKNIEVNAVLVYMKEKADENKIKASIQADIPEQLPFDSVELAVVISNLFENAIEAGKKIPSEDERWVQFSAKHIEKKLMIEVLNSFEIEPKEKEGVFLSEKGKNHGIGLSSVKMFAEKNGAIFDYEAEEKIFRVRLLFFFT